MASKEISFELGLEKKKNEYEFAKVGRKGYAKQRSRFSKENNERIEECHPCITIQVKHCPKYLLHGHQRL